MIQQQVSEWNGRTKLGLTESSSATATVRASPVERPLLRSGRWGELLLILSIDRLKRMAPSLAGVFALGVTASVIVFSSECAHATVHAEQADVDWAAGKQATADDAGDLVNAHFQIDRIQPPQAAHVEDQVAVVGGEALAQFRRAAALIICNSALISSANDAISPPFHARFSEHQGAPPKGLQVFPAPWKSPLFLPKACLKPCGQRHACVQTPPCRR